MKTQLRACGLIVAALALAPPADAYLGGFEQADGYHFIGGLPDNWIDVTHYNAGQHGANAGGGSQVPIPYNTGLWKVNSQVGAFFPTATLRNFYIGTAPPYPISGSLPPGTTVGAYVIGDHPGGRTGNALGLRNYTPPGTGRIEYDYTLDTYDFGGIAPASVTSGPVQASFWFWPSDPDPPVQPIQEKLIMSYTDSGGNIGFQWGYARDNSVYWRPGSSGAWNPTGVVADNLQYDGVTVDIDLTSQTFGINYFDTSTSTNITIVPGLTPLGASMADFTHIGWSLTDNVLSGPGGWGGKNFFDDFSFKAVPEPGSVLAASCGLTACLFRRRRLAPQ
jgi:hypothetical protein